MRQTVDTEYIDMYDIGPDSFWVALEHMGRYAYAAWMAGKRKFGRVLDVACANGYGCEKLAEAGAQVTGIDINEKLIAEAARRHAQKQNIRYLVVDADRRGWTKELGGETYDMIVCFEAIEHIAHPEDLLPALAALLRPNGRILLSVPAAEYEPLGADGIPVNPFHRHVFSRLDISAMLTKAQLSVERILGQPDLNRLMRKHNTFCSRNPEKAGFTTESFIITQASMQYYIYLFAYPEKGSLKDAYSHLYVLKR